MEKPALIYKIFQKTSNITKEFIYTSKAFLSGEIPLYKGEFGYEIILQVPFAYFLKSLGLLKQTYGLTGTKPLYFFSPKHTEVQGNRKFEFHPGLNSSSHKKFFITLFWKMPNFKKFYSQINFNIESNKPFLIIHNKYTEEWSGPPINFLSVSFLKKIIEKLKDSHTIIYIRPGIECPTWEDGQSIKKFDDIETIKTEYPEVLIFSDLLKKHPQYSYNELQFILHTKSEKSISVQGGNSVIASLFGGINLVLAKRGLEINAKEYSKLYPKFSECRVIAVSDEESLLKQIELNFCTQKTKD